jgi:type IV pilus assembly protein PilV
VLVTMVLLGVGLLGLAGLQLRGMQVNQGSTFRSQAAILAEDLADRMRADAATAAVQGYDGQWLASGQVPAGASPATTALVADWMIRLGSLPAGCVNVGTTTVPPLTTSITVTWDDTRAMRAASTTATAPANPACVVGQGNGSYVLTTDVQPNG